MQVEDPPSFACFNATSAYSRVCVCVFLSTNRETLFVMQVANICWLPVCSVVLSYSVNTEINVAGIDLTNNYF